MGLEILVLILITGFFRMIAMRKAVPIPLINLKANLNMLIMKEKWEMGAFWCKQLREGII
jgi:hypothetical protein